MHMFNRWAHRCAALILFAVGGACNATGEPEAQHGSSGLALSQSSCLEETEDAGVATDEASAPVESASLVVDEADAVISATLAFNCAAGELCASITGKAGVEAILVAPCEETTERLAKCSCFRDVEIRSRGGANRSYSLQKRDLRHADNEPLTQDVTLL